MSYCQKNRNHHCTHAHNCKDPSHKKKTQRINSASHKSNQPLNNFHEKYRPPMGTIVDNEQCEFNYTTTGQGLNLNNEALVKKINSLTLELQIFKRDFMKADIENRKLKQRNSHVECQIEYLRQQLDVLVNNHNTDISKEIKRSLTEHTELNIKIKELTSALFDKEKLVEELSSENYSLSRKNRQLQGTVKSLEERLKLVTSRNQELSFSFTSSKTKVRDLQSQLKLLKDRYSTLASAADKSSKMAESQSSEILSSKEKLQKSFKTKDSENKRLKELHEVEKRAWEKMIEDLKKGMGKKEQEARKYRQNARKAEQSECQLRDDLQHAKKLIVKYQKVNQECDKIRDHLTKSQGHNQEELLEQQKKTVVKISTQSAPDQPTLQNKLAQIQRENVQLRLRVQQLQNKQFNSQSQQPLHNLTNLMGTSSKYDSHTVVINEELILSIGASEEFKRIVEQKNATIKKLMRQKADLYNQIYLQQAHR